MLKKDYINIKELQSFINKLNLEDIDNNFELFINIKGSDLKLTNNWNIDNKSLLKLNK